MQRGSNYGSQFKIQLGRLVPLIAISLTVSYVLWILFVGTLSAHELIVGILATLLAVGGTCVVDVQYPARFSPSVAELLSIWRLPWYLVSGTWRVLTIALNDFLGIRKAQSLFLLVPFRAGDKTNPRAVARRVLAVTYTTMSPESIVLGVNTNTKQMLYHELERSPVPKMTQGMGAQP